MGDEAHDGDEHGFDARILWLDLRVQTSFGVPSKATDRLRKDTDSHNAVASFLNSADQQKLIVYLVGRDELFATTGLPNAQARKSVVFLKKSPATVEEKTIGQSILHFELGSALLQHLLLVAENIFLPLLSLKETREAWPEVIAHEVSSNFNKFLSSLCITAGAVEGKTVLPLPASEVRHGDGNRSSDSLNEKDRAHMLESAVVTWTKQVKDILATAPEHALRGGEHPGPLTELDFWREKADALNSVDEQLRSDKVSRIIDALKEMQSTYYPAFGKLLEEVALAKEEANSNRAYLETLRYYFDRLESCAEFSEASDLFQPMMYTIYLIWTRSSHYNTPIRMVVLLRKICNDIIRLATEALEGNSLLTDEPADAVAKLDTCLVVCRAFRDAYTSQKEKIASSQSPWAFQDVAVFSRFNAFLERCYDINDLLQTTVQFAKLEKIEIGGTKGKALTNSIRQISNDFQASSEAFQNVEYNIMNIEAHVFDEDFYRFRSQLKELDRRLASILVQGFDDCSTVNARFRLLDSFDGLLSRNIIKTELEKKQADLLHGLEEEIMRTQDIFVHNRSDPPIFRNMPPIAGAVTWGRSLVQRVVDPMNKFVQLHHSEGESTQEISSMYALLVNSCTEYERLKISEWVSDIEHTSQEKLKQPLLCRDQETRLLTVNFDSALVRLLREVKYFLLLDLDVPESAMSVYKKAEVFRQQTGNLDLIVNTYNMVLATLLDVERPLVQQKLDSIDHMLEKGLRHLNWKSHGINDFIRTTLSAVNGVNTVLQTMKSNVLEITRVLSAWSASPMVERKDQKTYEPQEFAQLHTNAVQIRHREVEEGGREIHKRLLSSYKALKLPKGAHAWKLYVEYVNNIVIDGVRDAVCTSLEYMRNQIDPEYLQKSDVDPLLEVRLELDGQELNYSPRLDQTPRKNGIRDLMYGWLESYIELSCKLPRLDTNEGNYFAEMEDDERLQELSASTNALLLDAEEKCQEFASTYEKYSYLWLRDRKSAFQEFLHSAEDGKEPSLERFDEEIARYRHIQEEIQQLPNSYTVGWLRIDARPVKHSLSSFVGTWSYEFTSFLHDKVTQKIEELCSFMEKAHTYLEKEVEEGDKDALLTVMQYIHQIRVRAEETDEMFEPLRHTIQLLAKYGTELSDDVLKKLDDAPIEWSNVKKKTFQAKERLSATQSAEAERIRSNVDSFTSEIAEFRKVFLSEAPFAYSEDSPAAYASLDNFHAKVQSLESRAAELNKLEELFELNPSLFMEVRECRRELSLLKSVVDMTSVVHVYFDTWKRTLWDDIDVENLLDSTKGLMKDVKSLNKLVRDWECYKGLFARVNNMQRSLPLVSELHSPAMRDRHWKSIAQVTSVPVRMDENFSLADLLSLNLHNFEEDVVTVVDRANKELLIEKALAKIEATWSGLELQYSEVETINGEKIPCVKVSEEVMEALEDNMVQLQNMQASKHVAHFDEQVTSWQQRLGNVESVILAWIDVQKKWTSLEAIFIGSADIRAQLPEDSKRFESIDTDFKELMRSAVGITNVIQACGESGRLEALERMQSLLELCEKALAEYLETKRIAFPRFYFVSPSDLLDILSKGANPHLVQRHLAKCFDNIKALEFADADADADAGAAGGPGDGKSNDAIGMYSKEGEYVAFAQPFRCEGAVESWLNGLVDTMRKTLRGIMATAIDKLASGQTLHEWLFDYCAQVASVGSRVTYTSEVGEALDKLEEGQENALRDYNKRQQERLAGMTKLILGDLSKNDRKKIITLVTVDVHNRDVVARMIDERVENAQAFQWQSQLRYSFADATQQAKINICDAEFLYDYEYIGNCGCLVITPLTDRCYITLTQALRLVLGGAPAGPAGTGKTETTKDLGRALGVMVYVFNCSDQMDYKSMGQIFKGLSQTGAWGCFDEFNRISIEVLSVCSTQVKCVLDAVRAKRDTFNFEEVTISLRPTCGFFITMNPGYAGRTELPESLKALFRPCAMIVPDMMLICEIMLMAEGFYEAKILAKKFVTLYRLCEDLLSKQRHYDWKLRAIKSVLVIAGSLKRAEPDVPEDRVMMRALRDFNLPKVVAEDVPIFMGLIGDFFPKIEVERKRDHSFEEAIVAATREANLQPDEKFVLKVVQLRELLAVRWSVFVLGPAGAGKSQVWRTLARAQTRAGERTETKALNPKAVTSNELFGYVNPATREWKDGLFSIVFRDLSNIDTADPKWIVLDGDIDPEWIESLNTVMDDNKTLTLASNERIPLTDSMRLIFEVGHLRNATPATVSRAGVLFINDTDVGWQAFLQSWLDDREEARERSILEQLCEKYIEPTLAYARKNFKTVVPLTDINKVSTLCYILEGLLDDPAAKPHLAQTNSKHAEVYEALFVQALVWALGGALAQDKTVDYVAQFSKWWREEQKTVLFPDEGSVLDYWYDFGAAQLTPWADRVPTYEHMPDTVFGSIFVPTADSTRLSHVMNLLAKFHHPVMFVGTAGTGKTCVVQEKLRNLPEELMSLTVNLNCFTDSEALQGVLESVLEKKAGRVFGPPGPRKLIYFIDDLNMPEVDKYGTQAPLALVRQHLDYVSWYDRNKMSLKEIRGTQYLASMNPTAGSFVIDPRLQRHFATLACHMPPPSTLYEIYHSILSGHMVRFEPAVSKLAPKIVHAAIELHKLVSDTFLPTAVKFHYQFNLRDLANVFQGMCKSTADFYTDPLRVARLLLHETERVYGDRLVSDEDMMRFEDMLAEVSKKFFDDLNQDQIFERPLLATSFIATAGASGDGGGGDRVYVEAASMDQLSKVLEGKLAEYNETYAQMNLVLFEQAIGHVCRIARIIENPRGNALLVGVGGSGKQSLARLAAFICEYDVFQISLSSTYGVSDFKADLTTLYQRAGLKGQGTVFLLTDSQIINEQFLVFINDVLSSGNVPDLFAPDEVESICNAMRAEVKQSGLMDTKENCWDCFIEKVRRNLHVVLCFSPVGNQFRVRARQFPALINCTSIDWFHAWPTDALVSVASRFLRDVELGEEDVRENLCHHIAFVHNSVNEASRAFLQEERRYNYTTPKSFLELIELYKKLLAQKRSELRELMDRLDSGLVKLKTTSEDVALLQETLQKEQVIVDEKKQATEDLLVRVGQEQQIAEEKKQLANAEEKKCNVLVEEVSKVQEECERDLLKAEPALKAAEAALDLLDKKSLTELKSLSNPPKDVLDVTAAVIIMMTPLSNGKVAKDLSWNTAKKTMGQVDRFLTSLLKYDKENIPDQVLVALRPYLDNPNFNGAYMKQKSLAASGLCEWVKNIVVFYEVYRDVEPKRKRLAEANERLSGAKRSLAETQANVAELEKRLAKLTDQFEKAIAEKNRVVQQAEKTQGRLSLANRLINGLSDENSRWREALQELEVRETTLVGDVMLASAFVSYIGAFNSKFRLSLAAEKWLPDIQSREIPCTDGQEVLDILTDDAQIAQWTNEGLPSDRLSIENGTIINTCARWPLIIDPQLQGVTWIKNREKPNGLKIVQPSQHKYLESIEHAIQQGEPVLLQNIDEDIDAVLEPVLSRSIIKRGRNYVVRIGDKEVEYDPRFRLYLQTTLSNPHYRPEIAAQTTLINFSVTTRGLEDQLLAKVVGKERPDLEEKRAELLHQQNEFKIELKELEDALLFRLSKASGDILGDTDLIENLEKTKIKAKEIAEKVKEAKETEAIINEAREVYRPVAVRGSLLFFLIDQLNSLDHMYQYSMGKFTEFFFKAIDRAEQSDDVGERVANITNSLTRTVFTFVQSGLFERHKLIFSSQMCFRILQRERDEIDPDMFDFLLKGAKGASGWDNPCPGLSDAAWNAVQALKELEPFANLAGDIESAWKRWREWCDHERPETEPLPAEWKKIPSFQKLLITKCLRPDRMTEAIKNFISESIGAEYVRSAPFHLERSMEDASKTTPVFFILSPGVNPVHSVEALGKRLGMTTENNRFFNVSLGQGQEPIAERAFETAFANGGWVCLQNVHLTPKWTRGALLKKLDQLGSAHEDFRLFLTSDPSKEIPISMLQQSIKLTNEPPGGLRANFVRALSEFDDEYLDSCSKGAEFKTILATLCYFHAILVERIKFGPQGWNRPYPFNLGDLTTCAAVLVNYLENSPRTPWDDLKYIFGDIMYGGHITDDWDRLLCRSYLDTYMKEELLDGLELFQGFALPPPQSLDGYIEHVEEHVPSPESPIAFGMHPNAEIGFRTSQGDTLFALVAELQPRTASESGGMTLQDKAKVVLDDIMDRLPEQFNMIELFESIDADRTPFQNVFLQECDRMVTLLREIRQSLHALDLGLKGDLTISSEMEELMIALFDDRVPALWEKYAYPSLRPLGSWLTNLIERHKQLADWTTDFATPKVTWISGLFNPQSFLTAVMQVTARKNDWPLDRTVIQTEVTKKSVADVEAASATGAYISGLRVEGARWDTKAGCLEESRMKELYSALPVTLVKAVTIDRAETKDSYQCPVYMTQQRGPTFVFTANLRSKADAKKWTLAGTALLMDVVE